MKRFVISGCLLCGLLISSPAMSQGYVGFAAGPVTIDETTTGSELDDVTLAVAVYGGYPLSKYVSVELSFMGSDSLDYETQVTFNNQTLTLDLDFEAWAASVNLYYPLGQVLLFGSFGMAFWEAEVELDERSSLRIDDDAIDPVLGFGFEYQLAEDIFLRGQWIRINADGDGIYSNAEIDTALLGIQIHF